MAGGIKDVGYCAVSPGVIAYNFTVPSITGNATGLGQLVTATGKDMVEPFHTTLNGLAYVGAGLGGVWGGVESLIISVLGPPVSAAIGALDTKSSALDGCVGLADEISGKTSEQLKEMERAPWLR